MMETVVKQIIPMVIAGIITTIILEKMQKRPEGQPPVADSEKHWWQ